MEIWYTGIRRITKMNDAASIFLLIAFIFWIPFGCFAYIIAPKSKIGRFMSLPFIKFITLTTSYLFFILFVVINNLSYAYNLQNSQRFSTLYPLYANNFSAYTNNQNLTYRFESDDFYIRMDNASTYDIIIIVWLIGLILNEVKQIYFNGVSLYLYSMNNIVNICMLTLYVASFALKFYTMFIVRVELNRIDDPEFWYQLSNLNSDNVASQARIYGTFYWLNIDRYYWFSLDPMNLSEGLLAFATMFTFGKLCFYLPANQNLGPLQITVGRMIWDVLKFICIFVIVFAGFLFGLNHLYAYYQSDVRDQVQVVPHLNTEQNNSTYINAELSFGT